MRLSQYSLKYVSFRDQRSDGTTWLYVIGEPEPCWNVKIGISRNPHKRLSSLQSGHHSRLVIHRVYEFPDTASARAAERKFHKHFSEDGMCGEWFGIPPSTAIEVIEEAHTWPVSEP
jgi:hypothetical protein